MIEARANRDRPAMADLHKLLICAAISLAAHAVFARVLELLPAQPIAAAPRKIEVRVVERKPEPPPELPAVPEPAPVPVAPVPPPPVPPPPVPPRPRAPIPHEAPSPQPAPTPPSEPKPAPPTPANEDPVFDVSMSSTSQAGNGPQVGGGGGVRGGTGSGGAGSATAASGDRGRQTAEPVPDYAVTTLPLPQGRCFGQYTDDARKAGVEGTVVLDLVIGEDGRVRDVDVTSRLGHGLDQAAVAALRACRFTPGEKDGQHVAVRVRGFKVRFALADTP